MIKTIKKVVSIVVIASLSAFTLSSAYAMADFSTYPEPFVKDGKINSMIVIGKDASVSDVIGAIDIAASLPIKKEEVKEEQLSKKGKNKFKISSQDGFLEIGEFVHDEVKVIGPEELDILHDGIFTNQQGNFEYKQRIYFGGTRSNGIWVRGGAHPDTDETGMYMIADALQGSTLYFMNYTLTFNPLLETRITNASTNNLIDLVNRKILIQGEEFEIIEATRSSQNNINLVLMSGTIKDTLEEGSSQTYTINGKDYEISVDYIGSAGVKFRINGESLPTMTESETNRHSDGLNIGVKNIMENEAGEDIPDKVEFYIGAHKIEFKDSDISDFTSSYALYVDGKTQNIADVIITGRDSSSTLNIETIKIVYYTTDDIYSSQDESFAKNSKYPSAFLNFDLKYEGMSEEDSEEIQIKPVGRNRYNLKFSTPNGNINMPLAYSEDENHIRFGDDDHRLVTNASRAISKNDYFILTSEDAGRGAGELTQNSVTNVLQYKGTDPADSKEIKLKFKDLATGEEIYGTFSNSTLKGELKLGELTYTLQNKSAIANNFNISFASSITTNFVPNNIVTKYGARIILKDDDFNDDTNSNLSITILPVDPLRMTDDIVNRLNLNLSVPYIPFAVDGLYMSVNGTNFTLKQYDIIPKTKNIDMNNYVQPYYMGNKSKTSGLITWTKITDYVMAMELSSDPNKYLSVLLYGAPLFYKSVSEGPDEMEGYFPKKQVEMFVTAYGKETKPTIIMNTAENKELEIADIPFAVFDTDPAVQGKEEESNLIVIGGPAVNRVAAKLLGKDYPSYGEASGVPKNQGLLQLVEQSNENVALIVSGWSNENTLLASKVLSHYKDYQNAGLFSGTQIYISGNSLSEAKLSQSEIEEKDIRVSTEEKVEEMLQSGMTPSEIVKDIEKEQILNNQITANTIILNEKSNKKIAVGIISLALGMLSTAFYLFRKGRKDEEIEEQKAGGYDSANINDLRNYIANSMNLGCSKKEIAESLVDAGWQPKLVENELRKF